MFSKLSAADLFYVGKGEEPELLGYESIGGDLLKMIHLNLIQ